jgi:hypothetical protein
MTASVWLLLDKPPMTGEGRIALDYNIASFGASFSNLECLLSNCAVLNAAPGWKYSPM